MDNRDIEVLDDFSFEDTSSQNISNNQSSMLNENIQTNIAAESPITNNNQMVNQQLSILNNNENNINQQSSMLNNNEQLSVLNNNIQTDSGNINQEEKTTVESLSFEETKQEENPVVEMINNKSTMKLIVILLIILFIAVFFMPKIFELIGTV